MSDKNSQSRYSASDMVEAAHSNAVSSSGKPKETREVIVQDDGTKVVKVRRRKRKSSSADALLATGEDEKTNYLKTLLITLSAILLTLAILAGIFFFKIAFFNSPDHITKLEDSLSKKLVSTVDIQGYRVGPTNTALNKVVIESGASNSPYLRAELKDIKLAHRLETVILGKFNGNEATAQKGTLVVDYHKDIPEVISPDTDRTFYDSYKHKDLEIAEAFITLGDPAKPKSLRINNAKAKLLIRADDNIQTFLRDGIIENLPGLPKKLETAIIVNDRDELVVQTLKLSNAGIGNLEIKGRFSKLTRLPQLLSANFENLRLESLDEHLAEIMEVRVNSVDGNLQIAPETNEYRLTASLDSAEF